MRRCKLFLLLQFFKDGEGLNKRGPGPRWFGYCARLIENGHQIGLRLNVSLILACELATDVEALPIGGQRPRLIASP